MRSLSPTDRVARAWGWQHRRTKERRSANSRKHCGYSSPGSPEGARVLLRYSLSGTQRFSLVPRRERHGEFSAREAINSTASVSSSIATASSDDPICPCRVCNTQPTQGQRCTAWATAGFAPGRLPRAQPGARAPASTHPVTVSRLPHTARYPARHGIPHGTVSRTARYSTRHGIPHGLD